ncbi:MAG: hypothetical protein JST46_15025 [Bacteroidetes bacterium]|nr:hypothetical protein [Bacteroidota bacterium]
MKKIHLFFYWIILALLVYLNYGISKALYLTTHFSSNGGGVKEGLMYIALILVPLVIMLGLLRLWLLKPAKQRLRLFDIVYFVAPVLVAVSCFANQLWTGIISSGLAGILIVFELIRSFIDRQSLKAKDNPSL